MIQNNFRRAVATNTNDVKLSPTPNWTNIVADGDLTNFQQMQGIDTSIILSINTNAGGMIACDVYCNTANNAVGAQIIGIPVNAAAVQLRVEPGTWIAFSVDSGGIGATSSIVVSNASDGNALLDTIGVAISP